MSKTTKSSYEVADVMVAGLSLYWGEPPTWDEIHKMLVSAGEFARSQEAAKWDDKKISGSLWVHRQCGRLVSDEGVYGGYFGSCKHCDEDLYQIECLQVVK